jgi:hypothetical protein
MTLHALSSTKGRNTIEKLTLAAERIHLDLRLMLESHNSRWLQHTPSSLGNASGHPSNIINAAIGDVRWVSTG